MNARRLAWIISTLLLLISSCFKEPPLIRPYTAHGGTGGVDTSEDAGGALPSAGGEPPSEGNAICRSPVKASEKLVARANVISDEALPPEQEVFVTTLFEEFKAQCGACHYDASYGDFQFNRDNFWRTVTQDAVDHMKSDDPTQFMPPPNSGGIPWSTRKNDAITHLVSQLEQWIAAGSKPDVYYIKNDVTDKPYVFTGNLGTRLTNLGSCVPDKNFAFGSSDAMDALDAMFAASEREPYVLGAGIPPEEQLGLPLLLQDTDLSTFDSATLARNGVIAYVPTYPLWTDGAGKLRHVRVPRGQSIRFNKETQKFEIPPNTRFYKTFFKDVIDRDGNPRWRKMETRLIVVRPDKIVDGKRVPQSLFGTYQWDPEETRAELVTLPQRNDEPFKDVIVTYTPDEPKAQAIRDSMPPNLTYELEYEETLRRYAIPGRERCIQCHMGSDQGNFVLGFTPLQIRRRKTGEGGTYEPTPRDELSQLERLIAYGVITGIDSIDDVQLLEDSEGTRKPRNDYELKAQGYMLGNCAHCHNPNGFPSQVAPELAPLLDFFPDADGGVFQFPLERFSPRVRRGPDSMPIAYITPSLREIFPFNWDQAVAEGSWTPKDSVDDKDKTNIRVTFFPAPWRSLVWRNVQNAFPYSDDYTLYPHMPMNTAGYDCRAEHILGEWMVSIPAVRKHPQQHEDFFPSRNLPPEPTDPSSDFAQTDREPQPYVEVRPDAAGYASALKAAQARLDEFHGGAQYQTCLKPRDIVDPGILRGDRQQPPDTSDPPDGVPDQPHWVSTDLTERAGPWHPRREQWKDVLITDEPGPTNVVVPLLRQPDTKISAGDFETFAKTPFPMAEWKVDAGCDFGKEMKASDFSGTARPRWLDVSRVQADAPIYRALPGQAVFDMICTNCHGPHADSKGRQADTVQLLSGGETRVANLRDGLFGPPGQPGQNMVDEFGSVATPDLSARDWAGRYMAWMALGGTQRIIPKVVLIQVGRTDVAGTARAEALISPSDLTANMLESARAACQLTLPSSPHPPIVGVTPPLDLTIRSDTTALIEENGDAELWQRLCSINNEPVVRVFTSQNDGAQAVIRLYRGKNYPAGAPVGDHQGHTQPSLDPKTNFFPFCVNGVSDPPGAKLWREQFNPPPPYCPEDFLASAPTLDPDDVLKWSTRGAINAGFAVFVFLDELTHGRVSPIHYNECQLLKARP
jgi:mono/diheme cytochrome c family protein